jgi:hypothetical protein
MCVKIASMGGLPVGGVVRDENCPTLPLNSLWALIHELYAMMHFSVFIILSGLGF